jgi:hypothetical protein
MRRLSPYSKPRPVVISKVFNAVGVENSQQIAAIGVHEHRYPWLPRHARPVPRLPGSVPLQAGFARISDQRICPGLVTFLYALQYPFAFINYSLLLINNFVKLKPRWFGITYKKGKSFYSTGIQFKVFAHEFHPPFSILRNADSGLDRLPTPG